MIKTTSVAINIDCNDRRKQRDFYAKLAGWAQDPNSDEYGLLTGGGMCVYFMGCDFDYVPPVWPEEPGRQQKQTHFDFCVEDLPAVVEEALRLGAVKAAEQFGEGFSVTLLDPEGRPFCLIDPKPHPYFTRTDGRLEGGAE